MVERGGVWLDCMQKRAFDYTQSIPLIVSSAEDTDDPNNDKEKNEPVHLIKACFAFPSEARIILPPHKMESRSLQISARYLNTKYGFGQTGLQGTV